MRKSEGRMFVPWFQEAEAIFSKTRGCKWFTYSQGLVRYKANKTPREFVEEWCGL